MTEKKLDKLCEKCCDWDGKECQGDLEHCRKQVEDRRARKRDNPLVKFCEPTTMQELTTIVEFREMLEARHPELIPRWEKLDTRGKLALAEEYHQRGDRF